MKGIGQIVIDWANVYASSQADAGNYICRWLTDRAAALRKRD